MRKNAHDANCEVMIETSVGHTCFKSQIFMFTRAKMRFGDLETDFARRYNDIKLEISPNMALNVILALIALITVQ